MTAIIKFLNSALLYFNKGRIGINLMTVMLTELANICRTVWTPSYYDDATRSLMAKHN